MMNNNTVDRTKRALGTDQKAVSQLLQQITNSFPKQKTSDYMAELKKTNWELKDFILIRTVPKTSDQLRFLQSLQRTGSKLWIQFWRHPDTIERHTDFWISPKNFNKYIEKIFRLLKIHYTIVDKELTTSEELQHAFTPTMENIDDYDETYHTYDGLLSEMTRLVSVYDDILSAEVIGKSSEGRPIHVVHLSRKRYDDSDINLSFQKKLMSKGRSNKAVAR